MTGKMKVAVMNGIGKMGYTTRDIPTPKDDEVLVKLEYVGICGSDMHYYETGAIGHYVVKPPFVLGHEPGGTVVEVGSKVKHLKVGDRVALEPGKTCGHCKFCREGQYNLCPDVVFFATPPVDGVFQEYVAHEAALCFKLPETVSTLEGALIEPLAVTVHAAKRFPDINGANVSIIGCGPIGILLMQSCKALGAAKVLITDISDYRLELAKSLGADYAINTAKVPYADAIAEVFGPDKADVTYECAGNNATTDMAIQNSRKGSVIVLVAVFADWAKVDLARLNDSELTLDTSMMYRHEDYVDALRFVAEGKIQLKPLISKHFAFRDFLSAYQYIDANRERTMKVVVDIQD